MSVAFAAARWFAVRRVLNAVVVSVVFVPACRPGAPATADSGRSADSAFAGVHHRGAAVMGVDQTTSKHVFEDLPTGGRIVLERPNSTDSAGIATIRQHMRGIAADFCAGDFTKPFAVHARVVPGTNVMTARRQMLSYDVVDRPRGAEVRILSTDTAAVRAVHEFLEFQRSDHRAMGHDAHGMH